MLPFKFIYANILLHNICIYVPQLDFKFIIPIISLYNDAKPKAKSRSYSNAKTTSTATPPTTINIIIS